MPDEPRPKSIDQADLTFAKAITYFRIQAGLRQQDVAQQLGVSHQQYQKYERGTNRITIGRASQIAIALDVPLPVLLETVSPRWEWAVDRDAGRLMQQFQRIDDASARHAMLRLAEVFARLTDESPNGTDEVSDKLKD